MKKTIVPAVKKARRKITTNNTTDKISNIYIITIEEHTQETKADIQRCDRSKDRTFGHCTHFARLSFSRIMRTCLYGDCQWLWRPVSRPVVNFRQPL